VSGCRYSGPPESFEPSNLPEILSKMDEAIFGQESIHTETDVYRFQSYGAATYGTETRLHYTCHEMIPDLTVTPPNLLSYCQFERETVSIHVLSGELRGDPERIVNESLVRGREGWVKQEGSAWYLSWELKDSDLKNVADAFKISPFFSAEQRDCGTGQEYPHATRLCFDVNIPGFLKAVYQEDISYVDCVGKNQGVIWIDPQTQLPYQWQVAFSAAITFPYQESDEEPYNVRIEMSQKYPAFNEEFDYPEP
jgi:hypothetical protein